MAGIEMEGLDIFPDSSNGDFCESILHHFSNSDQEDSQRLCATVGAMAQELKEQDLPLTPIAYFGTTCSSLERLVSEPDSPPHVVQSLTTILSLSFSLLARDSSAVDCERSYMKLIREVSFACRWFKCEFKRRGERSSSLYVLDALKESLPLMSAKHMTTILKYYKTSLELRQPLVNRRVTDSLNSVYTYPNVEVSAEALLDSLSFLALSVSANETSPVSLTFNSRLLSSVMMKVNSLNRQLCVIKLPIVFSALKDILGSEHEEAIFSATEAFKTLINGCIDEGLIKQGVDQIIHSKSDYRKSGPTLIENVCAIVESLLDYHYSAVWDMAFQIVSTMFNKLGTIKNLADMQRLPDKDFPYRKLLHECVGSALGIFLESTVDEGGSLQSTIGEFASIAHVNVVRTLFKKTMLRLLKVTQEAGMAEASKNNSMQVDESSSESSLSLQRMRLFDLAVSLLPGLDEPAIDVLFSAMKPALQDVDGLILKKAYKVLSTILRNQKGLLSAKLEELLKLMIEVLPSLHFSAKRHRLDCLYHLITYDSEEDSNQRRCEILSSFLTEIILALKDVARGLAGETPRMISAAVKGLARLAYEFFDFVSSAYKLFPPHFFSFEERTEKFLKFVTLAPANLGLLKVLVAKSKTEGLEAHLASLVEGLLKWQMIPRIILKLRLHFEDVARHYSLIQIKERKEKKQAASSVESKSHLSKETTYHLALLLRYGHITTVLSRWDHTKIFSDFGDDDSDVDGASGHKSKASSKLKSKAALVRYIPFDFRSKKIRRAEKSLPEDLLDQLEDEPLNLLDRYKTRYALQSSSNLKRRQDSDDETELDADERLIIHEGKKPKKAAASDPDSDARSESQTHFLVGSLTNNNQKGRRTSESGGWAYTGSEYASKKAGDVKRKDKLELYAYWPLDRKMMSRRPEHRTAARKGMSSVVKMTKKLEGKSASTAHC
ncbi:hypothetical protein F3Y22_tig00111013pilonHSYRG00174 [Hibiscus syriacus]|uniref:Ribosomal RNA-processing protein 12-like conserved domain-containing protein n=1 Tax=Hibiscus syriacus TaxID=106335 RepID=A0A6A2Z800_HIBSY|nr:hypothetical protein F3Y22_tig00111013pilonHSYRG00174 [Hibiscus syriacus]